MNKTIITTPDGKRWEQTRYGFPKKGELFLDSLGYVHQANRNFRAYERHILKPLEEEPEQPGPDSLERIANALERLARSDEAWTQIDDRGVEYPPPAATGEGSQSASEGVDGDAIRLIESALLKADDELRNGGAHRDAFAILSAAMNQLRALLVANQPSPEDGERLTAKVSGLALIHADADMSDKEVADKLARNPEWDANEIVATSIEFYGKVPFPGGIFGREVEILIRPIDSEDGEGE